MKRYEIEYQTHKYCDELQEYIKNQHMSNVNHIQYFNKQHEIHYENMLNDFNKKVYPELLLLEQKLLKLIDDIHNELNSYSKEG